jgi:RNA polymerase sigma-70 factor (ECF subfamily)
MDVAFGLTMGDLDAPITLDAAARPATADLVAAFYDSHQRELFGVTLRACRDRETAEDLVQEAFARLIVEVDAGRIPDNVRAWLHRVTANLVVSRSRRTSVARKWQSVFAVRETAEEPERNLIDFERRSDLSAVMAELPVDARTALLLAARGFSGQEIAAAIGRSENATRTMMSRARLRLRQRLETMEARA